ncbi:MAG: family 10 glycosylhydrolase [Treponema sp.]|nr:family 10 glycosylhydrolase [Treponema sp.]
MKKLSMIFFAVLFAFTSCVSTKKQPEFQETPLDVKGVWFSFYDWASLPQDENEFKESVKEIVAGIKKIGLNVIFLHAHSHSDSYYKESTYFPLSSYISYAADFSEDFDPYEFFIQQAHEQGIQVHAWFNPYRVGSDTQFSRIQEGSLLYEWKESDEEKGSRYILHHRGAWYLNPSSIEILNAVTNSIREMCRNYNIDGVHFDDYFYPEMNDSDESLSFDKIDWESSGSEKTLEQWRRDNVSALVQSVYEAVHEELEDGVFGISPAGNIPRLTGSQQFLVDLEKWIHNPGYIDYILPQIYWGFEPRLASGATAPWAFEDCLSSWVSLLQDSQVKLYAGLALYRLNTDVKDGNEVSEWLRYDDIIFRQIECCRRENRVTGFSLFDWRDLKKIENKVL